MAFWHNQLPWVAAWGGGHTWGQTSPSTHLKGLVRMSLSTPWGKIPCQGMVVGWFGPSVWQCVADHNYHVAGCLAQWWPNGGCIKMTTLCKLWPGPWSISCTGRKESDNWPSLHLTGWIQVPWCVECGWCGWIALASGSYNLHALSTSGWWAFLDLGCCVTCLQAFLRHAVCTDRDGAWAVALHLYWLEPQDSDFWSDGWLQRGVASCLGTGAFASGWGAVVSRWVGHGMAARPLEIQLATIFSQLVLGLPGGTLVLCTLSCF